MTTAPTAPNPPKLTILIIGGGLAGLTLLHGLLRHHPHLDPTVCEATPAYSNVGSGMALLKNAIAAMASIDPLIRDVYFRRANSMLADDEVEMATQVILGEGPMRGEVVAFLGRARGRKTVARWELLRGLNELVPQERIRFGKRFRSVRDLEGGRVEVEFEDGSVAVGDCLIGADGIHSRTRKFLLGERHPAVGLVNHDHWALVGRQVPAEYALEHLPE